MLDQFGQPDRVGGFDQHRVAGAEQVHKRVGRFIDGCGALDLDLAADRLGQRRHLLADQDQPVDASREKYFLTFNPRGYLRKTGAQTYTRPMP